MLGPSDPVGGHCVRLHEGRGPLVLLLPRQCNAQAKTVSSLGSSASAADSDGKGNETVADADLKTIAKGSESGAKKPTLESAANTERVQPSADITETTTAVENVATRTNAVITGGQTCISKINVGDASDTTLPPKLCNNDSASTGKSSTTDAKDAVIRRNFDGNEEKSTTTLTFEANDDVTAQPSNDAAEKPTQDANAGANAALEGRTQNDSCLDESQSDDLDTAQDKSRCVHTHNVTSKPAFIKLSACDYLPSGCHDIAAAMVHWSQSLIVVFHRLRLVRSDAHVVLVTIVIQRTRHDALATAFCSAHGTFQCNSNCEHLRTAVVRVGRVRVGWPVANERLACIF